MSDGNPGLTRRGLLGLAGSAMAGFAGCTEAATNRTYRPPDEVRTRPPGATVQPTGTPPTGPFREVYEAAIGSVAAVRTGRSQGTCYAHDGTHLLTNQHVVRDADRVSVQYADDDWAGAEVVATDVYSDLAVLADPDRPDYVDPLPLVDYPPAVGQEVVVIGTPFGLRGTLSTGAISGVDRGIEAATGFSVPGAVQTDAPLNPGNSGGPLLSLDAAVLGVVSAAGGENIGFGIPPQLVRRVVPDLIEFGNYQHPYLGVTLREVTPAVARANDLGRARGVIVVDVVDRGPVEGVLRPSPDRETVDGERVPAGGDVLLELDGRRIGSIADLQTQLAFRTFPGDDVPVRFLRDGTERTATVPVGVRPPP